jgi:hypothetical protein
MSSEDTLTSQQSAHESHPLHKGDIAWQETNCYVDLWIELLHGWGLVPEAALPFTVAQDFEGDQFTFFKFPPEDIEALYGASIYELSLYDDFARHVETQTRQGNVVLVEVDAFYLPDTRATSYRREHKKTTVGFDRIDATQRHASYYHNAGYFSVDGDDYAGLLRCAPDVTADPNVLMPYAEVVKRRGTPLQGEALVEASLALLRRHLARRPARHPVSAFRAAFAEQLATLLVRGEAFFHAYAFNTLRQLGANFELLGQYLHWLERQGCQPPEAATAACRTIASEAKVLQFRLVRAIVRQRADACDDCFEVLTRAYDEAISTLVAWQGREAS